MRRRQDQEGMNDAPHIPEYVVGPPGPPGTPGQPGRPGPTGDRGYDGKKGDRVSICSAGDDGIV